jgi:peptide/nickel transport system ATP-binding protein
VSKNENELILDVKSISKHFPIRKGAWNQVTGNVKAVDNISFYVKKGETLGLVGESGCGKTTLGRCIVRGISTTDGSAHYYDKDGNVVDFLSIKGRELRRLRKDIQMIFQDPYGSLDPRMTVYDIISEPMRVNRLGTPSEIDARVKELAHATGLNIAHLKRYPHAFSGGQRQRIGIARALATQPRLVVCDEAVSALDVSIQAQVINLLEDLQKKFGLTYLFVAHDLSVVEHISDRVAVMYVGKMVELAETDELFNRPLHPYTEALLSAVPKPDPRIKMERIILEGEVPNPASPPHGCYFHPRCPYRQDQCMREEPVMREVYSRRFSACHRAEELSLKGR